MCHFKVHSDVQEPYYNEFKDLKEIEALIVPVPNQERWSIDTVGINKIILKQAGLKDENIIDCKICSVCNSDLIHSYRVEKEGYGLGTAIIELNSGLRIDHRKNRPHSIRGNRDPKDVKPLKGCYHHDDKFFNVGEHKADMIWGVEVYRTSSRKQY